MAIRTCSLNRYRNFDADCHDLAHLADAVIPQPSLFIAGADGPSVGWMRPVIDAHTTTLPALTGNHLLPDTGHWVHQQRPDDVNRLLLAWLQA